MSIIIERFKKIKFNIDKLKKDNSINIVAISKTFPMEHILPLIKYGHLHFGENKVQEAENKWKQIRKEYFKVKLHLVGKLQSNKAKKAAEIFDYIHSLDSQKLADILSKRQNELNKSINYFIQVNVGNEKQKSGIPFNEVDAFYNYCCREKNEYHRINGYTTKRQQYRKYFRSLSELNSSLGLKDLSLGMSNDYLLAINFKSTYIRLGTSIFGDRG